MINAYRSVNPQKVSHPPLNLANKSPNQTGQSTSANKQNNFHYSKFNNHKNNNKSPLWTNRPPGVNEYKKPAAPTVNSSYKRDDKGPNALKPLFHPAVNANYQNHPSVDKSGNPICYQCRKIGYANECPNHLQQTRVFAMGLTEVDDAPAETQYEPVNGLVEESPDINDDEIVVEEVDDELDCNARFGSMTFIDPTILIQSVIASFQEKLDTI